MSSRQGDVNRHSNNSVIPGIFIAGLPPNTTSDSFIEPFKQYGEIAAHVIKKDSSTGLSLGYGFITFADPSVVEAVILDVHMINGRYVNVKRARPGGSKQGNDCKTRKIFVDGFPPSVTEDELKSFFSKYGNVLHQKIISNALTQHSQCAGFILFDNEKVVDDMLQAEGNTIDMDGTPVQIRKVTDPRDNRNTARGPAYGSESRARPYHEGSGGFGDYSGYGSDDFRPTSSMTMGGFGGRSIGDYGEYGGGDFGGSSSAGSRGVSPFCYSGRPMGSFGGHGAGGFGGRRSGGYRGEYPYEYYGSPMGGYDAGGAGGHGGFGGRSSSSSRVEFPFPYPGCSGSYGGGSGGGRSVGHYGGAGSSGSYEPSPGGSFRGRGRGSYSQYDTM